MPDARNTESRAISLPKFSPREPITADNLQTLSRAIRANSRGVNSHRRVLPDLGWANATYQFIITANDNANYLTCQLWDSEKGEADGVDVRVSKPYLNQAATLNGYTDANGVSYTFTGIDALTALDTGSSVSEDWVITLPYVVGDLIYAVGNVRGGIDNAEDDVDFIDLNIDGRAWAVVE